MRDWKSILLATDTFIANEYLDAYISLISMQHETLPYMEKHHIIPVAYYKHKYNIDTRKHRREATKYANADPQNDVVLLSFADHCKAHWLLIKCTVGPLSTANAIAFFRQIAGLRCIDDKILRQQHKRIFDTGLTKNEYEWLQQQAIEVKANTKYNTTWTPEQDEWLKQNRPKHTAKYCAGYLGKTENAILCRSTFLGIKRQWQSEEENARLLEYSKTHTAQECADYFGVSKHLIIKRWKELGFSKTFKWNEKKDNWLRENDSKYTVAELAEKLGTTKTTVMGRRWTLGITRWDRNNK